MQEDFACLKRKCDIYIRSLCRFYAFFTKFALINISLMVGSIN